MESNEKAESNQSIANRNLFTERDYHILRRAIEKLPGIEHTLVKLRFWEQFSILEIAECMGMEWDETDRALTAAFKKLKEFCMADHHFSRSRVRNIFALQSQNDHGLKLAA
jgi:DNA-directed RNA polymerase specialized sigma24 family protein